MALWKAEERKRNKAGQAAAKLGGVKAPKDEQTEGIGSSAVPEEHDITSADSAWRRTTQQCRGSVRNNISWGYIVTS